MEQDKVRDENEHLSSIRLGYCVHYDLCQMHKVYCLFCFLRLAFFLITNRDDIELKKTH